MGQQATLTIKIWTEGGKRLPKHDSDLPELFAPHLERIAGLCEQGCHSGQVWEEGKFNGWWTIDRDTSPRKTAKTKHHLAYARSMSGNR